MKATVNGEERELRTGTTVAWLLEELQLGRNGIAVAVNQRVVRTAQLDERRIEEGDVVEIIRAVAGG